MQVDESVCVVCDVWEQTYVSETENNIVLFEISIVVHLSKGWAKEDIRSRPLTFVSTSSFYVWIIIIHWPSLESSAVFIHTLKY